MVLLYLVALVQLVASWCMYKQSVNWEFPRYSRLEDKVNHAAKTSSCSTAELCQKDALFYERPFNVSWGADGFKVALGTTTVFRTINACLQPLSIQVVELYILCKGGSSRKYRRFVDMNPFKTYISRWVIVTCEIGLFVVAIMGNAGIWNIVRMQWGQTYREATLVVDFACQAVNIGLSPWKNFFDINESQRARRIAQYWFNV